MIVNSRQVLPVLFGLSLAASTAQAQLQTYTDRASWEAAVAAAGSAAQFFDFSGLTTGRVVQLDTNYDFRFRLVVDRVSATSFSNPGIDIFPDASCSLGSGDCNVFTLNVYDPTTTFDGPRINQLILPQPIVAFGGDFIQVGMTAPSPGSVTGPVTLTFGSESVVVNSFVDSSGNGFFGFVASAPSDTVSFTFTKSFSLQNDIFQVYNPAFGTASVVDPAEEIDDVAALTQSLTLDYGIENSLLVKLAAAKGALNGANISGACTALTDFISYARAQRGKKIPTASANQLILQATDIRLLLDCE